ncbi:MAG: hypothetical protein K2L34_11515, partial [Muribaculaceae bacterium]|nr:hypothetical protein [Muribaculaceae bacterium]
MRKELMMLCLPLLLGACVAKDRDKSDEINDSTTPLHLLKPDYRNPYGEISAEQVKEDVDRVFRYIDAATPARVVDKEGNEITDLQNLPDSAMLNQGTYRLTSYEWGVTYMALLKAAELLKKPEYKEYVTDRVG